MIQTHGPRPFVMWKTERLEISHNCDCRQTFIWWTQRWIGDTLENEGSSLSNRLMDFNHGMLPAHTTTLNDKYLEFLDITERQLHNT